MLYICFKIKKIHDLQRAGYSGICLFSFDEFSHLSIKKLLGEVLPAPACFIPATFPQPHRPVGAAAPPQVRSAARVGRPTRGLGSPRRRKRPRIPGGCPGPNAGCRAPGSVGKHENAPRCAAIRPAQRSAGLPGTGNLRRFCPSGHFCLQGLCPPHKPLRRGAGAQGGARSLPRVRWWARTGIPRVRRGRCGLGTLRRCGSALTVLGAQRDRLRRAEPGHAGTVSPCRGDAHRHRAGTGDAQLHRYRRGSGCAGHTGTDGEGITRAERHRRGWGRGDPGTPVPSGPGLPRGGGCGSPRLPPRPEPLGALRGAAEEDANSPFPHQLPFSRSGEDL